MGEIDTKPIEPVQVALTLFGDKGDQKKQCTSSSSEEMDKEKDVEGLLKDMANYKVQLEAKESAHLQALHKLEHYQQTCEELSTLLKNSEADKHAYMEECLEARLRNNELEAKMKEMADQLSETGRIREQLSQVLYELKATQVELLGIETELAASNEAKIKALTQAELMETAAYMEKERAEELLKTVAELNEAVVFLKLAAAEAENEKLSENNAEMDLATETAAQVREREETMRKQTEMTKEFGIELLAKSAFIDSLQFELNQANELLSSSDKVVSNAINDLNQLKADLEGKEKENSDQASYIGALETEMHKLKMELGSANNEISCLNRDVEMLTDELQKLKTEMDEIKEKENEAQVEIAFLQSELHRGRSKLAAAEAAEARAGSIKSGLYHAVQQLAVEAEEAKRENRRLKQGADKVDSDEFDPENTQSYNPSQALVFSQTNESKPEIRSNKKDSDKITISLEEYESLIRKAKQADQSLAEEDSDKLSVYEAEILKKELVVATAKIAEFRTRAEQAATRAEAAEKAKFKLEDQLRKWKAQKQRRKAAFAALREESSSIEFDAAPYENSYKPYQPLGKVLNMKF